MSKEIRFSKTPVAVWIPSILLAFFVDIKAINRVLVYGGYVPLDDSGLMGPMYLFAATSLMVAMVMHKSRGWIVRGGKTGFFLASYLTIYYILTLFFLGQPYTSFDTFAIMTVFSLIAPQNLLINTQLFMKATMLFPLIAIPRLFRIFGLDGDALILGISMDVSYGFLVSIIASIIYAFSYLKNEKGKEKALTYVGLFGNAYISFYIILFGSRAPILCIFLLLAFLYICKYVKGKIQVNKFRLRIMLLAVILIIVSGIAFISLFNSIFHEYGLEIKALDKLIGLAEGGDISNGRADINAITWKYIYSSPIFGYGFDRYDELTHNMYPHNFLLQLLFDGGMLLFFVVLFPIWRHLKLIWHKCTRDQYYLIVMLFFTSVPGALFSQNMWQIVPLWVCFGAIIHCQTTDCVIVNKIKA